ncbi:hypothetical protein, partial [Nonomuraea sp. MG754425]|uniref:hypothetical protein n=1 Tax=Nonomuraea sp. MG754425 TaxID=2570319 RepID=UPI001F37D779
DLLHRARRGDLYVYPHSMTRPGGGIQSSDLVALSERGLTLLGPRSGKGRQVQLTRRGHALVMSLATARSGTEGA